MVQLPTPFLKMETRGEYLAFISYSIRKDSDEAIKEQSQSIWDKVVKDALRAPAEQQNQSSVAIDKIFGAPMLE